MNKFASLINPDLPVLSRRLAVAMVLLGLAVVLAFIPVDLIEYYSYKATAPWAVRCVYAYYNNIIFLFLILATVGVFRLIYLWWLGRRLRPVKNGLIIALTGLGFYAMVAFHPDKISRCGTTVECGAAVSGWLYAVAVVGFTLPVLWIGLMLFIGGLFIHEDVSN